MASVIAEGLRALADLVAPPFCGACRERMSEAEPGLCAPCAAEVERTEGFDCLCCGQLLQTAFRDGCGDCRGRELEFRRAVAWAAYRGPVERMIVKLKYSGEWFWAAGLARKAAQRVVREGIDRDVDCVVPVPSTWKSELRRGYNPAGLIAKEMAKVLGLPLFPRALARKGSVPQMSLPREARWRNAAGAFPARSRGAVRGRKVLLVDDVMTTGATASECSRTLKAAGAAEVWVAAVARS